MNLAVEHREEVRMEIGSHVKFVDERMGEHEALVTNIFPGGDNGEPSLNVVYVSTEEDQHDQYGRQIVRKTSIVHKSKQYAHGLFWY